MPPIMPWPAPAGSMKRAPHSDGTPAAAAARAAGTQTIWTATVGCGRRVLMPEGDISHPGMSHQAGALPWAETQVPAARDDPARRFALLVRTYHGPPGRAPRPLPFRRAALSFMRW